MSRFFTFRGSRLSLRAQQGMKKGYFKWLPSVGGLADDSTVCCFVCFLVILQLRASSLIDSTKKPNDIICLEF